MVSCLQLKISIFLVKGIYYNFNSCLLFSMSFSAFISWNQVFRREKKKKNTLGKQSFKRTSQKRENRTSWNRRLHFLTILCRANSFLRLQQPRKSKAFNLILIPAKLTILNHIPFVYHLSKAIKMRKWGQCLTGERRPQTWQCRAGNVLFAGWLAC